VIRTGALALLLAVTAAAPAAAAPATPRVIGGTDATIAELPWMAAIVERGESAQDSQFCGGTVIAPQAILTAAHCTEGASAADMDVVTGATRLSDERSGQRIQVAEIRQYPRYDPDTTHGDASVLLLKTPTSATPIALPPAGDRALTAAGSLVGIAGWGGVANIEGSSSNSLLRGVQQIVADSRCETDWKKLFDGRTQLCAVGQRDGRPDTCPGDSGGPMTATDGLTPRVVGIVSFGSEKCGVARPAPVYTRVSAFAAWIAAQAGVIPPNPGPTPEPPAQRGKIKLKFGRIECGVTCRISVGISGDGALAVTAVQLRATVASRGKDKTLAARRVGARSWRGQFSLPVGRVRLVATAFDRDGKAVGKPAKETVIVSTD
jgi:secreted trypsin-like serine protease